MGEICVGCIYLDDYLSLKMELLIFLTNHLLKQHGEVKLDVHIGSVKIVIGTTEMRCLIIYRLKDL